MMIKKKFIFYWCLALLFFSAQGSALLAQDFDTRKTESKIHSVFIYNFTRYLQWPEEDFNKFPTFQIGVLGESPLIKELMNLSKIKEVNGQKIEIKEYNKPDDVEPSCRIVYITAENSNMLSQVLRKTRNSSTLVITNKDGLARTGSLINFVKIDGEPTFEMNTAALEERKLKYAQQLKTVAIVL